VFSRNTLYKFTFYVITLHYITGSSGDAPNADALLYNTRRHRSRGSLLYNNNDQFTTYDRDNDDRTNENCAVRNVGGFWYSNCAYVGVNIQKGSGYDQFEWHSTPLKKTRMWLIC